MPKQKLLPCCPNGLDCVGMSACLWVLRLPQISRVRPMEVDGDTLQSSGSFLFIRATAWRHGRVGPGSRDVTQLLHSNKHQQILCLGNAYIKGSSPWLSRFLEVSIHESHGTWYTHLCYHTYIILIPGEWRPGDILRTLNSAPQTSGFEVFGESEQIREVHGKGGR